MSTIASSRVSKTSGWEVEGSEKSGITFDPGHETCITDAKMDHWGTKLATASSDKTVNVFAIDFRTGGYHRLASLGGFDAEVTHVEWSHPKFGSLLATSCYSGKIIIWKEVQQEQKGPNSTASKWEVVYNRLVHEQSVNCLSWSAPGYGSLLAAAGSDGRVSIMNLEGDEKSSVEYILNAHRLGCVTVSWSSTAKRLASAGNDYQIKIWSKPKARWTLETTLSGHSDWICCAEWAPYSNRIASSSHDGRIVVWTETNKEQPLLESNTSRNIDLNTSTHLDISMSDVQEDWSSQELASLGSNRPVYVSWDPMGTFLCVSDGEKEKTSLWKHENDDWVLVHQDAEAKQGVYDSLTIPHNM